MACVAGALHAVLRCCSSGVEPAAFSFVTAILPLVLSDLFSPIVYIATSHFPSRYTCYAPATTILSFLLVPVAMRSRNSDPSLPPRVLGSGDEVAADLRQNRSCKMQLAILATLNRRALMSFTATSWCHCGTTGIMLDFLSRGTVVQPEEAPTDMCTTSLTRQRSHFSLSSLSCHSVCFGRTNHQVGT